MKNYSIRIKHLITIFLIIIIGYFVYDKFKVSVSIGQISEKLIKKAYKNEIDLYNHRKKLDPSFHATHKFPPISYLEIDVVIPIVKKDLDIITYTVDSIRKLVNHKINKIYFVAPNDQQIKAMAKKLNCEFILEDLALPSPEIKKFGGWILQQFIKLNMEHIVQKEHYLVVDADTIFLRPVVFERKDAYLINVHTSLCPLRKKTTSKILHNKNIYVYDFVTHHMLFSKKILTQMKQHIENIHKDKWYNAIIKLFNSIEGKDHLQGFAEYELYSTFLTTFSNQKFKFVSNANFSCHRNFLKNLDKIIPAYASKYKSISMHAYIDF